jgi:hypothetical protein
VSENGYLKKYSYLSFPSMVPALMKKERNRLVKEISIAFSEGQSMCKEIGFLIT